MNINTSKKALIAQSVLLSLTGTQYKLRSLPCLAKEAGASEADTREVVDSMGLTTKRRRSDGATLYGISGLVNGNDVVHIPVAAQTSAPIPAAASVQPSYGSQSASTRLNDAKGRIVVALEDRRWTTRSRNALKQAGNVDGYELDAILRDLNVRDKGGYIGLRSRIG